MGRVDRRLNIIFITNKAAFENVAKIYRKVGFSNTKTSVELSHSVLDGPRQHMCQPTRNTKEQSRYMSWGEPV